VGQSTNNTSSRRRAPCTSASRRSVHDCSRGAHPRLRSGTEGRARAPRFGGSGGGRSGEQLWLRLPNAAAAAACGEGRARRLTASRRRGARRPPSAPPTARRRAADTEDRRRGPDTGKLMHRRRSGGLASSGLPSRSSWCARSNSSRTSCTVSRSHLRPDASVVNTP
jgi:hypothetical protein